MVKIAVCDDSGDFSGRIKAQVQQYFSEKSMETDVRVFSSGGAFLSDNSDYGAVFLDIDIPDVGGFEIAEQIDGETLIVFVTTHDELVYSSLKFRPFRFIRKARLEEELSEALDSVYEEFLRRIAEKDFMLETKDGEVLVNVKDLVYIEIYGHRLWVHTAGGEVLECYGSLSVLENRLSDFDFVRAHKSYLVNCRYIYSIQKNQIVLDDKTAIPLSRYKAENVRTKLKNHLRRAL